MSIHLQQCRVPNAHDAAQLIGSERAQQNSKVVVRQGRELLEGRHSAAERRRHGFARRSERYLKSFELERTAASVYTCRCRSYMSLRAHVHYTTVLKLSR